MHPWSVVRYDPDEALHVNRWALIWSCIRLITWHAGHCRINSDIMRSVISLSPCRWCTSRSRRLQMSNPQWPTLELWTLHNRACMSGGNTITGQRATMRRSAKVGGVEVHDLYIVWIMHQIQIDAPPCREHEVVPKCFRPPSKKRPSRSKSRVLTWKLWHHSE